MLDALKRCKGAWSRMLALRYGGMEELFSLPAKFTGDPATDRGATSLMSVSPAAIMPACWVPGARTSLGTVITDDVDTGKVDPGMAEKDPIEDGDAAAAAAAAAAATLA
mmetsp:Transcript_4888/g.17729  ORF Transcript_4888/g.17729 Transcript_4888/m.17729 type:complete len:109 (+) Transcript_4888:1556-1882(+)|eukprot:scaffold225_cov388-Prasinococcus_capsulatus_cf.AAC.33